VEILGHIYYTIGILIILLQINSIMDINKISYISLWSKKFRKISGKDPIEEDFKDSSDITLIQKYLIFVSIEMIWLLFGLMTNIWKLYLITLLSSFLIGQIIKRLGNLTIITFLTRFISIFRFCITLFLIINHFHLHIDLIEWIKLIH